MYSEIYLLIIFISKSDVLFINISTCNLWWDIDQPLTMESSLIHQTSETRISKLITIFRHSSFQVYKLLIYLLPWNLQQLCKNHYHLLSICSNSFRTVLFHWKLLLPLYSNVLRGRLVMLNIYLKLFSFFTYIFVHSAKSHTIFDNKVPNELTMLYLQSHAVPCSPHCNNTGLLSANW